MATQGCNKNKYLKCKSRRGLVTPRVAISCGLSSAPISGVKPLGIIPLSRGPTLRRYVSNPKPSNKKRTILQKTYHGSSVLSVRQSCQLCIGGVDREWPSGTPGQFELMPTKPCSVISSPVATVTHRSIGTLTLSVVGAEGEAVAAATAAGFRAPLFSACHFKAASTLLCGMPAVQ